MATLNIKDELHKIIDDTDDEVLLHDFHAVLTYRTGGASSDVLATVQAMSEQRLAAYRVDGESTPWSEFHSELLSRHNT